MRKSHPALWSQAIAVALAVGSFPASAWGQENRDQSQLVAQVDPSVVTVALSERSLGSGFVVDEQGLVITNYHVIEGAKEATVIFPDKTKFPVEGFLAIVPRKDLALLRIQVGTKRLQALRIADQLPSKGERVYAFGAPMGLSGSVSDGIVASLRSGDDVRDHLRKVASRDVYTEILNYDLDAQWLQTTAPISPGNSGGPLVNGRGEVVGINTWVHALGQNLNFALSAVHVKQLLAGAGAVLHPFSELPKPRPEHAESSKGDGKKTLALWNQLIELRLDLTKKAAQQEKKLKENSVPVGKAVRGVAGKLNKMAAARREEAKAYAGYAGEIKTLETEGVDPDLALLAILEADLAQRFAAVYEASAAGIAANSAHEASTAEYNLKRLNSALTTFRTGEGALRMSLAQRYHLKFPAFESVLKEGGRKEGDGEEKGEASASADRSALRTWTDRSGKFQIRAKYLATEGEKVKLEKADGTLIAVPYDRLSDEDQKFLGADKRIE